MTTVLSPTKVLWVTELINAPNSAPNSHSPGAAVLHPHQPPAPPPSRLPLVPFSPPNALISCRFCLCCVEMRQTRERRRRRRRRRKMRRGRMGLEKGRGRGEKKRWVGFVETWSRIRLPFFEHGPFLATQVLCFCFVGLIRSHQLPMHVCMSSCTSVCMHACMHVCVRMFTCMYAYVCM